MLGFLPLERIPIFIWALMVFAIGAFLAIHDDFQASGYLLDVGLIVIGGVTFFYDVRKRIARSRVSE